MVVIVSEMVRDKERSRKEIIKTKELESPPLSVEDFETQNGEREGLLGMSAKK